MGYRIAIASSDGKVVNTHFGHAGQFYIAQIENGSWQILERRDVTRACHEQSHSESGFDAVLDVLSDCQAVLVSRIGYGASAYLISKGIRVFETAGFIEDVLDRVVNNRLLEKEAEKN